MATDISMLEPTPNKISPDVLYEVIDGQIVELPAMGTRQEVTASDLHTELGYFGKTKKLGRAVVETLFDFTEQLGKKRRPDVAFVSFDRWPKSRVIPEDDGWKVIPELAVEVVSRTNSWEGIQEKIAEYFQVGVSRVWVISPAKRLIYIYDSPTSNRILSIDDTLTDEELLPGFELPLRELFETSEESN